MIPAPQKLKLDQLRQEAAMRAQLQQQYQADMAGRYTKDMIPFAQWLSQRQPGMAKGGVLPKDQHDKNLNRFLADSTIQQRMYTGTSKDKDFSKFNVPKNGAWFTPSTDVASSYAKENDSQDFKYDSDTRRFKEVNTSGRVLPVYLRATKPYKITAEDVKRINKDNYKKAQSDFFTSLRSMGHDAAVFEDGTTVILQGPHQIKSAIGNRGTYDMTNPDMNKAEGGLAQMSKGGKPPESTVKAYKLFRVHPDHPGKLFPLFVNANKPVEMNKWVDAEVGPQTDTGKVKSKLGPLAYRPGWHAGDVPVATHIGEKSDPSITAPDRRPANHAWAEVEMPNDVDWQAEANKRGTNAQGKLVPVKAHITDQIPKGGHYRYKTNPNMTGNWLIGGSMNVKRVLTDKEVEKINRAAGVSDLPRAEPFNKKKFGFKQGGQVTHAHHLEIEERPL